MNSLILSLSSPTPPKRKRQSLPLITSKNKQYHYSLHLAKHINPPQLSISGPHSQRLKNQPNKPNTNKLLQEEIQTTHNYPQTSRRSEDKHLYNRERTDNLFLVRNKNNYNKKKVFLKSMDEDEIIKPKRDFDQYLTHIKSNSQRYTLTKPIKRQSQFIIQIIRTIRIIFTKVSQSLQHNPITSKQLCITYLSLHQKIQLQHSIHLPINQSPLNKLFILQRLISYYIIILFGSNKFNSYIPLFIKSTYYFSQFFQSLGDIIKKKQPKLVGIGTTVKSTQLLCQIDKGCGEILGDMKLLMKPLSRELYEADKQLMLLMGYINEGNFIERLMKLEYTINWKLFKLPLIPYLPSTDQQYTLLLQLDTTITYYDQTNKLLMFRPYLQQLLDTISTRYQVILYTISTKQYADKIIQQIDPFNRIFKGRLYNEHISVSKGVYFKDLGKLGRDLEKVVIVDSQEGSWRGYEENGVGVEKWYGGEGDQGLKGVIEVLKEIGDSGEKDVRRRIRKKGNRPLLTHISQEPQETLVSNK